MSTIKVYDRIDENLVRSFEKIQSTIADTEFRIRIKSNGGNYGSFGAISKIIFNIAHKKISIIGEAEEVGSAAMLLFLNCTHRIVQTGSSGYIHLPEPNTDVPEDLHEKTKKEAIAFIKRRTHLSEDTIISLNNIELTSNEMIKWKIATQKVRIFDQAEP